MLNREAVLSTTPLTTFLTLLFELLLGFGICEAKIQFDSIMLDSDTVEFSDNTFCNFSTFEAKDT